MPGHHHCRRRDKKAGRKTSSSKGQQRKLCRQQQPRAVVLAAVETRASTGVLQCVRSEHPSGMFIRQRCQAGWKQREAAKAQAGVAKQHTAIQLRSCRLIQAAAGSFGQQSRMSMQRPRPTLVDCVRQQRQMHARMVEIIRHKHTMKDAQTSQQTQAARAASAAPTHCQ